MTKRNTRNRRHGTNEMATKGRVSPTASENIEYSMIDLVRSVERLHFCKSGDRKETVMWADVKKHYKKNTGRVLTTETFNKLAGVTGASRKDLIAGPLAGLLVAEDPAALVLRFKYDATKGDPLINHRFYLEASGAKTSVHHADENVAPRLARASNTVSPSRSDTESSSSLSPTCLSSISTDPDTEALSPLSATSPLSSAPLSPLSPETRDFVTANEDLAAGDRSFLTARTTPMESDWETSPSSHGADNTETSASSPHNCSFDQEKTLNLLDVSMSAAETTIGASEVLVDLDSDSVKMESVMGEEQKMEREEEEKVEVKEEKERKDGSEEGSDKENHVETTLLKQQLETSEKQDDVVDESLPKTVDAHDDEVIVVPEAVQEVIVETSPHPEEKETLLVDDVIETSVVENDKKEESEQHEVNEDDVSPTEEVKRVKREEKTMEEEKEEEELKEEGVAAGDAPLPVPQKLEDDVVVVVDATSPVTTSSSDEHMLTVIERAAPTVSPQKEEKEEEEHKEEPLGEKKEEKEMEVKENVIVFEKTEEEEEQLAADVSPAAAVEVKDTVVEVASVEEDGEVSVEVEEEKEEEKREESPVEEMKEVEPTVTKPLEETPVKEEERAEDTVEKISEVAATPAVEEKKVEVETDETASSTTEEPTATTMVAAASVAPMQQQQTPLPSHEPMTSDDVDMNDILAGGPNRDVHTPSVTAPITLQPKPASRAQPEEDDDSEVITSQPVVDELDCSHAAAAASTKEETAASPDDLALRRATPTKKFPCCTIV